MSARTRETYVVCAGLDLCVEPVLVLVPEGRVAHQQDVEDDPACPDVDWLGVRLLLQHLRGQVAGGSGKPEPRLLVALDLDGQPEVSQLHSRAFLLGSQQQILWLKSVIGKWLF